MITKLENEKIKDPIAFDFFKTKKKEKPKLTQSTRVILNIFLLYFMANTIWVVNQLFTEQVGVVLLPKSYKQFSHLSEQLKEKNILNLEEFKQLKESPYSTTDSLSSLLMLELVLNDNFDKKNKKIILDYYYKNWNYGIEMEKKKFKNCYMLFMCHFATYPEIKYINMQEQLLKDKLIRIKNPEILKKEHELDLMIYSTKNKIEYKTHN